MNAQNELDGADDYVNDAAGSLVDLITIGASALDNSSSSTDSTESSVSSTESA